MNTYKLNICFYIVSDEIEDKIVLNDNTNIVFINHGKKVLRKDIGFSKDGNYLFASVDEGIIYEVVIEAQSDNNAEEIVDLLNSCLALVQGAPSYDLDQLITNIHHKNDDISLNLPSYSFDGNDSIYLACKMLKRAIICDSIKIAVLKFSVAHEIFYLYPMDLEPFNDTYDYQYLLSRQIKMGYSIIVSYSILEELNLHVKASKEKPSSIDGVWNKEVVEELQSRLSTKGLNPNKKIPWLSRSTRNRPFKNQIESSKLCDWSDGRKVRDFEINITEAILETSYIRSQIASHSNAGKVTELCLYDVENMNMLIRSILLDLLA